MKFDEILKICDSKFKYLNYSDRTKEIYISYIKILIIKLLIMKIKRRFPNNFSGFEETEHEVNSYKDLMEIPWIKEISNIPNYVGIFYAPRDYNEYPDLLMSLFRTSNGDIIYFVIGFIYGNGAEIGLENYLLNVNA